MDDAISVAFLKSKHMQGAIYYYLRQRLESPLAAALQNIPGLPSPMASVNSGFVLNIGSPGGRIGMDDKDMVKAIEAYMPKYIRVLEKVGDPGCFLRCLDHVHLKDTGRPIAFIAKMIASAFSLNFKRLAHQLLGKGLMDPTRVGKLLGTASPREVILDILMITSDLA